MAEDKDGVHQTRAYGAEAYLIRLAPVAAVLLLLAIAALAVPPSSPPPGTLIIAPALAAASLAYIAFACWRRFIAPGPPRLVLSSDGIRQRLSHGRILHIPWDEVQAVASVDRRLFSVLGFWHTVRDLPAIVVSRAFYDRVMPLQPWLKRPLDWGHRAERADGTVQVVFFHDHLGVPAAALRHAIECRWRAFSRHPAARLPPPAEAPLRHSLGRIVGRWAAPVTLTACAIGLLYLAGSAFWLRSSVPESLRGYYLAELLDKGGVAARLPDGSMGRLARGDIAAAGPAQCEDDAGSTIAPLPPAAQPRILCTSRLRLPSGAHAVAMFRIVEETQTVEFALGRFREDKFFVPAPLSLEAADVLLCRLGHCSPATAGR